MFSLRNLRFLLCSLELDVLRAQRIMGIFYLDYPQINEVGKIRSHVSNKALQSFKKFQETRSNFLETGWHILIGFVQTTARKAQQDRCFSS